MAYILVHSILYNIQINNKFNINLAKESIKNKSSI